MSHRHGLLTAFSALLLLAPIPRARAADDSTPQTLDANGVKVAYYVQGEGEPVVLIHGWMASAGLNWDLPGVTSTLAKNYRVISLDVRGHGDSDKPTDEAAYGKELVEDVVRLLDHLKIKQAHLIGYSMGGIIAGNFTAKHPERVLSLVLGGMGWLKVGSPGQWTFAQIGKNNPNPKGFMICGRSLAKLALTPDEIKSIQVPTIVVIGAEDQLIKKLYVQPLEQTRKDWPIVEIKDAGHLTCVLKPQFREELVTWLKKQAP